MDKIFLFLLLLSLLRFTLLITFGKLKTILYTFSNSVVSFIAACSYLLPIKENIQFYGPILEDVPVLGLLFLPNNLETERLMITSDNNIDIFTTLNSIIENLGSFILFFAVYFIVIRSGKKYGIPYFIRYNVIHAILILLIQVPLSFLYQSFINYPTLDVFLKSFTDSLANALIIANFLVVFYSMGYAIINKYVKLPIITDAAILHIGKNE